MLYLGADHNGYFLKERIKKYLRLARKDFTDCGAEDFVKTDDYVDFAVGVGKKMKSNDLGVLFCGSGHGMVIAANKIKGIRAILADSPRSATFGRRDDHANVLVVAAWLTNFAQVKNILTAFLKTKPGLAGRYLRRLKKIRRLE